MHTLARQVVDRKGDGGGHRDLQDIKKDVQRVVYTVAIGRNKARVGAYLTDEFADLRFGNRNPLPFGSFPGAGLTQ